MTQPGNQPATGPMPYPGAQGLTKRQQRQQRKQARQAEKLQARKQKQASKTQADSGDVGHGLIGMNERVTALGGVLDTGPTPDGGFQIKATLPLPAASARPEAKPTSSDAPARPPADNGDPEGQPAGSAARETQDKPSASLEP